MGIVSEAFLRPPKALPPERPPLPRQEPDDQLSVTTAWFAHARLLQKWSHTLCILFHLISLAKYFEDHQCRQVYRWLISSHHPVGLHCMNLPRFIHLSLDEQFCCFQLLTISNKIAMIICARVLAQTYISSWVTT